MIILRFIHVVASFTGCQVIIHYMNIVVCLSIHLLMDIWMFLVWGYYKLSCYEHLCASLYVKSKCLGGLVATGESHNTPMSLIKTRFLSHQLAWIRILSLANHRYYLVCWDPTTEGTITQVPGDQQEAKA